MSLDRIPIQNLYYLLCYAWNRLEQRDLVDVSRLESSELVDLFATVLVKGIEHLARRGLQRDYGLRQEELRGVRGRIDVWATERRFLNRHGRVACSFDELTTNTLPNQIIKSTLRVLAADREIHPDNRVAVLRKRRDLKGVDDVTVTQQCFRKIQLNGNNAFYRFLLNVCELIHGAWLADEAKGDYRFRDFFRDEKKMALLFQHFVYHFLRRERPDFNVYREIITWSAQSEMDAKLSYLPQMETDISAAKGQRKIIVDTKYFPETLSHRYDSEKIHSVHLYQLFSYLMNAREPGVELEGVLLYPAVDRKLRLRYSIHGIPLRIETLDLAQPWTAIHDELKQLLN